MSWEEKFKRLQLEKCLKHPGSVEGSFRLLCLCNIHLHEGLDQSLLSAQEVSEVENMVTLPTVQTRP